MTIHGKVYEWLTRLCRGVPPWMLPDIKTTMSRLKAVWTLSKQVSSAISRLIQRASFHHQRTIRKESLIGPAHTTKPSLNVRNVNKKLKCRDEKIRQYKSDIANLSKENKVLQNSLTSAQHAGEQKCVGTYRMTHKMEMASLHLAARLQEIEDQFLVEVNAKVHTLCDAAKTERITELETQKIPVITKKHSQLY